MYPVGLLGRYWPLIAVVVGAGLIVRWAIVYGLKPPFVSCAVAACCLKGGLLSFLWSGLRGASRWPLASQLDSGLPGRDAIVAAAFGVVVFTLLVQGLSIRPVMRWAGLLPGPQRPQAVLGAPP